MTFEWNMAYAWLWINLPAVQVADSIGFIGISNLGVLLNGLVLLSLYQYLNKIRWWPGIFAAALVFAMLNGLGYWHKTRLATDVDSVRILAVQPNLTNEMRRNIFFHKEERQKALEIATSITTAALKDNRVDLIVWPETSFGHVIELAPTFQVSDVKIKLSASITAPLVFGADTRLGGQLANSLYIVDTTGSLIAPPYHKSNLLLYGEYLPGAKR